MYDAAIEASIKTHILIIIPFFFHAAGPKKETTTSITLSSIIITLVGYTIILHFYLHLLVSKIFMIRFPMRWDSILERLLGLILLEGDFGKLGLHLEGNWSRWLQ